MGDFKRKIIKKHSWNALGKLCITVNVSSQHSAVEKRPVLVFGCVKRTASA